MISDDYEIIVVARFVLFYNKLFFCLPECVIRMLLFIFLFLCVCSTTKFFIINKATVKFASFGQHRRTSCTVSPNDWADVKSSLVASASECPIECPAVTMFGLNYFQSQTLLQVFLGWEKSPVHVCRYSRPVMVVDPTVPAHC